MTGVDLESEGSIGYQTGLLNATDLLFITWLLNLIEGANVTLRSGQYNKPLDLLQAIVLQK